MSEQFQLAVANANANRPLAGLQDILDVVWDRVKSETCDNRAAIEQQANEAIKALAAKLPSPWNFVVTLIGPRLVDFALDQACGPDAD